MFINLTNIDFCPCNNGNSSGGGEAKLQTKGVKYTLNGEYVIDPDEGYDGLSGVGVIVNVSGPAPILQSKTSTITSNGSYTITSDEGYDGLSNVDVVVNVPTTSETDLTSYRYRYDTGSYDIDGLKALGWNNDSIAYYVYNESHTPDQDSNYIVTDGNKALYGTVNSSNISTYASNTNFIYCPRIDTAGKTSMSRMFYSCKYMQSIPLLDTSSVTDMTQMFNGCSSLQTIPLLNTSKVTNMVLMFYGCGSLQTIPPLNTSKVTDMSSMFRSCGSLQTIPQLDTSNVINMYQMFYYCRSLQTIPLLNTSKVTNMNLMFGYCNALQTIPQLDMSNVTDTANMFYDCFILSSIRLTGSLNVSLNISYTTRLDYNSVKSILTAASNTTNTNSKELTFNSTQTDRGGELASLVSTCTSKGWTVSGLTLN